MMEISKRNKEEEILLKSLGENLKKVRESKNMTQEALAYEAGFSRSWNKSSLTIYDTDTNISIGNGKNND